MSSCASGGPGCRGPASSPAAIRVRPLALGRALAVGRALALGRAAARARTSKARGLEARLMSAGNPPLGRRRAYEDQTRVSLPAPAPPPPPPPPPLPPL